jgi:hypothetical protein
MNATLKCCADMWLQAQGGGGVVVDLGSALM